MVSFNVTLNTRLLNERQPTIRWCDESEQIVKCMAVEVDRSVQLHGKIYELKDIGKHHLQHKKDQAKAAVEVEKRAIERDDQ